MIDFESYCSKLNDFDKFKEIANPKLDLEGKLLSPFRLEILMQDIAHLYGPEERVGVTKLNKIYAETSAKNNLKTGYLKQKKKLVS